MSKDIPPPHSPRHSSHHYSNPPSVGPPSTTDSYPIPPPDEQMSGVGVGSHRQRVSSRASSRSSTRSSSMDKFAQPMSVQASQCGGMLGMGGASSEQPASSMDSMLVGLEDDRMSVASSSTHKSVSRSKDNALRYDGFLEKECSYLQESSPSASRTGEWVWRGVVG